MKEEQPEDDKDIVSMHLSCYIWSFTYIILKKQQEIQPVITTSGNESAEIVIDSGNTTIQSESIQGIVVLFIIHSIPLPQK